MTSESGERRVTFKTLFIIAAGILSFLATGMMYMTSDRVKDAEAKIEKLRDGKLDRMEYYRDIGEIKVMLMEIRKDLHEHEVASQRRAR